MECFMYLGGIYIHSSMEKAGETTQCTRKTVENFGDAKTGLDPRYLFCDDMY
jgi:hypothetical protein